MHPVIIIGSGLAGYTLAKEFRKRDGATPITMVTRDDGRFYSKPMLSNGLSKNKTADDLATQTAADMAEAMRLTVLCNTEVSDLATAEQRITVRAGNGGEKLSYSALVLALGASQVRLPLRGDAAAAVLTVNDLNDYARFRQQLGTASRIALLGPGLIGCEFANDLINVGKRVTVIGPDQWPLERLMPQAAGQALQSALAARGVDWILGHTVTEMNRSADGLALTLDNGKRLTADLVLSAAGLVPNTRLASAAGLATNRGVVVDQYLRCSAENVYALGDCAEICGMLMPYVMPIMLASRALAATLQGEPTQLRLPAMPVAVKTPAHPVVVAPPAEGGAGRWHSEAAPGDPGAGVISRFVDERNRLLGFALTGSAVMEKAHLQRELPPILAD